MEKSREFLQRMLEGVLPTASDIDALVSESVKEGLYLDYKHGEQLRDRDEATKVIRKYMAGFANSDGGVLIVGIREVEGIPVEVTGCNPGHVGGKALDEWAQTCITGIVGQFTSRPIFHVASHPKGPVLVCAVARSYNLVQVRDGEKPYFIRAGHETLNPDDYLIADLVLGRRQQPILEVIEWNLYRFEQNFNRDIPLSSMQFELSLQFENTGLAWGEQCHWGMITRMSTPVETRHKRRPLAAHLHSLVDIRSNLDSRIESFSELLHFGRELNTDSPLSAERVMIGCHIPLAFNSEVIGYTWMAAIYIISRNGIPNWFQLALRVDEESRPLFNQESLRPTPGVFMVERVYGIRPKAGWIKEG